MTVPISGAPTPDPQKTPHTHVELSGSLRGKDVTATGNPSSEDKKVSKTAQTSLKEVSTTFYSIEDPTEDKEALSAKNIKEETTPTTKRVDQVATGKTSAVASTQASLATESQQVLAENRL